MSSSIFVSPFLIIALSCHLVLCTQLCKNSDWWYDIQSAKCRLCKTCGEKSLLMEPCSEFMNTLCMDLREIGRSMHRNIEKGHIQVDDINDERRPKWHETEGEDINTIDVPVANAAVSTSVLDDFQNEWGHIVMIVICVTFFFVFGSIIILIVRITGRRRYGVSDSDNSLKLSPKQKENRKNVARARLFSRDRLNTTEYMNNLATLDRRLAMDEILEKRKKAIFEPHLLSENVYTDEVFVDISGLPRNLHDDHEYEELDHSRCLLRIQDQQ